MVWAACRKLWRASQWPSVSGKCSEVWQFIAVLVYPTIFSGVAGQFACFWPGKRRLLRLLWTVCAPAAIARSDRIDCVYLHGLYGLCKSGFVIFHATYNARSFFRLAESEFHLPANRAHTLRAGLTPILIFAVRLAL